MNNFKLGTSVSTSSPTMRAIIFRIAKFVLMFVRKMMFLRRWRGSSISNYRRGSRNTESPSCIYITPIFTFITINYISFNTIFFIIFNTYYTIMSPPHIYIIYIFTFSLIIIYNFTFSLIIIFSISFNL